MSCYHSLMTEGALFNVLLPLSHAGTVGGVSGSHQGVSGSFGEGFGTRFGHVAQKEAEAIWGGARSCEGFGRQLCPSRVHRDLLSPMKNIDWSGQIPPVDRDLFGTGILNQNRRSGGGPRTKASTRNPDSDITDFWRPFPTTRTSVPTPPSRAHPRDDVSSTQLPQTNSGAGSGAGTLSSIAGVEG